MAITVNRDDVRFNNLNKAHNARYPETAAQNVSAIAICQHKQDIADALQEAVSAGKRPTVRAGGNCYEDFYINNPNGVLIDVAQLDFVGSLPGDPRIRVGPGVTMGKAYQDLYRAFNVTLPGASCTGVTAGGHIMGGGFGVLSRMYGITPDWVTEIEIATVDAKGKVVLRTINAKRDPDLFRACRGSGGGNFGIVTDYIFDKLPPAPQELVSTNISWPWAELTEEKFSKVLRTYGRYFETRGKDPDTWGIFAGIGLSHASNGGRLGVGVQFCNMDGTCNDLKPLEEFLAFFDECKGDVAPLTTTPRGDAAASPLLNRGSQAFVENCAVCHGNDAHGGSAGPNLAVAHVAGLSDADIKNIVHNGVGGKMPAFSSLNDQQVQALVAYLRSVQPQNNDQGGGRRRGNGGQNFGETTTKLATPCASYNLNHSQYIDMSLGARTGPGTRAKYKSAYLKKNFSEHEARVYYKYLTTDIPGLDSSGATVLIDSYGGAVNSKQKGAETSVYQRSSIIKHQFLTYWQDPAQDKAKIAYLNELYKELYTSDEVDAKHQGTPYPGEKYEGCYINYADRDLTAYDYWPELYWGTNYKFLQEVKRKYDPNNIFHHALSIRS